MGTELNRAFETEALNPEHPYMPKKEWESRIKKAQGLMEKRGLGAILILNNQDRLYFLGREKPYRLGFPYVGIIPRQGPTTLISENEDADLLGLEGYAHRNIGFRGDLPAPKSKAPDPIKLAAEVMKDLDLANKTIGMEFGHFLWWDGFNINEWEQFKGLLPEVKFVDASDLIWEMRTVKSEWEIGVMRHLYRATIRGYRNIIEGARAGKNERELFYEAMRIWMEEGIIDSINSTLNVIRAGTRLGPSAAQRSRGQFLALEPYRDRLLEEGDYILLDGGPSYKGYMADIQRMICIGDPGEEIRRAGKLAVKAQEAVEKILRPGITAGDIYRTGFSRVAEETPGIWHKMGSRKTSGWCGHGEGLNMHEPPYLFAGSDAVIREGMVISVEISTVVEDGRLANMPEDVYLITKNGFDKLTEDFGPADIYVKT